MPQPSTTTAKMAKRWMTWLPWRGGRQPVVEPVVGPAPAGRDETGPAAPGTNPAGAAPTGAAAGAAQVAPAVTPEDEQTGRDGLGQVSVVASSPSAAVAHHDLTSAPPPAQAGGGPSGETEHPAG
jgi:hypothetical protein